MKKSFTRKCRSFGFTLIELMIVVAIIGILAAIAIPKFADLIRKSQEGATKGNLGSLRSTLSIYYGDMEGNYPCFGDGVGTTCLGSLTVNGKYITTIPMSYLPYYHPNSSAELDRNSGCSAGGIWTSLNVGTWIYCNSAGDPFLGSVALACWDTDTKGTNWTAY